MGTERGSDKLIVEALRGGTVGEVAAFLDDLNAAYAACLSWQIAVNLRQRLHRRPYPFWEMMPGLFLPQVDDINASLTLPPGDELILTQVEIHSPGTWEFFGSLNPLQQIREYLNDRHERRKDRDYREAAEREKLLLENELLQRQLDREGWGLLRDELDMMRELGISQESMRQIYWQRTGQHLAKLGRYQDNGLIGRSTNNSNESWIPLSRK